MPSCSLQTRHFIDVALVRGAKKSVRYACRTEGVRGTFAFLQILVSLTGFNEHTKKHFCFQEGVRVLSNYVRDFRRVRAVMLVNQEEKRPFCLCFKSAAVIVDLWIRISSNSGICSNYRFLQNKAYSHFCSTVLGTQRRPTQEKEKGENVCG